MALLDTHLTVLEIINEVQLRLGLDKSLTVSSNKHAENLLGHLNKVQADLFDYGDWQELLDEIVLSAVPGQTIYEFENLFQPIHHIKEVAFGQYTAPLELLKITEIRQLRRSNSTNLGNPRFFTIKGVDVFKNPKLEIYPAVSTALSSVTANNFDILVYKRPRNFDINDGGTIPDFPSNVLAEGVYAYALMQEGATDGEINKQYKLYEDLKEETYNRYNGDTGEDTQFTLEFA